MKHKLLLIILLCSPLLMMAQDQSLSSVPVEAGKHLQTNYPDAIVLDWVRRSADQIAAQFQIHVTHRQIMEAVYTNEGVWIRTQSKRLEIPMSIQKQEWASGLYK